MGRTYLSPGFVAGRSTWVEFVHKVADVAHDLWACARRDPPRMAAKGSAMIIHAARLSIQTQPGKDEPCGSQDGM
jgi:hypothetical protein